jgi:4'-phosphopantetheinyl transferase
MDTPGWLLRNLADVPAGEDWLGERERHVLAGLRVDPRRDSWRLGRWAVKAALSTWLAAPAERIEVLAAPDGAPEAWLDGTRAPASVSISHRGGRALAVVAGGDVAVGCDLELVEPRSGAFVREWLGAAEQRLVRAEPAATQALVVNLIWTAKEAGAKVRREGLRLNVRQAAVMFARGDGLTAHWRPLEVNWPDGAGATGGWWRAEPRWVMTIATEPRAGAPRALGSIA